MHVMDPEKLVAATGSQLYFSPIFGTAQFARVINQFAIRQVNGCMANYLSPYYVRTNSRLESCLLRNGDSATGIAPSAQRERPFLNISFYKPLHMLT